VGEAVRKAPKDTSKEVREPKNRTRLQKSIAKSGAARTKNSSYATAAVKVDLIRASLAIMALSYIA